MMQPILPCSRCDKLHRRAQKAEADLGTMMAELHRLQMEEKAIANIGTAIGVDGDPLTVVKAMRNRLELGSHELSALKSRCEDAELIAVAFARGALTQDDGSGEEYWAVCLNADWDQYAEFPRPQEVDGRIILTPELRDAIRKAIT